MGWSKCPSCKNGTFKIEENAPSNSPYKLIFVHCSSCGTVVGVMDYLNIGDLLLAQNRALKEIANTLGVSVTLTT